MDDDLKRGEAHGLTGFYEAVVHFGQRGFDLPGEEGHGPGYKGNIGTCDTDACTKYLAGNGDQDEYQDDERNRTNDVDGFVQDGIEDPVGLDSFGSGDHQQDAEEQTDEE